MMTIYHNQIKQMQSQTRAQFVSEIIAYVGDKFPDTYKGMDALQVKKEVENLVRQAEVFLINTRHYTKAFVAFNCHYKWHGKIPDKKISEVFMSREYSPKEKFEIVRQLVMIKKANDGR